MLLVKEGRRKFEVIGGLGTIDNCKGRGSTGPGWTGAGFYVDSRT